MIVIEVRGRVEHPLHTRQSGRCASAQLLRQRSQLVPVAGAVQKLVAEVTAKTAQSG
jgi:hypothetical protein